MACYSPAGVQLDEVLSGNPGDELQFGGPDLAELYVTSAAYRLSTGQLKKEPHAGATLVCRPGAAGMPASSFAR